MNKWIDGVLSAEERRRQLVSTLPERFAKRIRDSEGFIQQLRTRLCADLSSFRKLRPYADHYEIGDVIRIESPYPRLDRLPDCYRSCSFHCREFSKDPGNGGECTVSVIVRAQSDFSVTLDLDVEASGLRRESRLMGTADRSEEMLSEQILKIWYRTLAFPPSGPFVR